MQTRGQPRGTGSHEPVRAVEQTDELRPEDNTEERRDRSMGPRFVPILR